MRIKRMTATFGRLENAVLNLEDGLNILEAPNEGGKSTWCAFLRAMLYGIPTKERDRAGYIAEKNRYQPWSGAAVEGVVDLICNGNAITLRRFQKGGTPFGGFEAVDTATGEPVSGLTADNAGETLIGVPRAVFERSAFVGQAGVSVDGNPELEKRIAALVSSGEEDVSFSQTERRLRDWLNRRRHNKSGLIPKLEGELELLDNTLQRLDRVGRALAEAGGEREALERKQAELLAEQAAQSARADRVRREEYDKAVAYLSQARGELGALAAEAGPLPEKEALRDAQGELVFFNTLGANLKVAENDAVAAEGALREAHEEAKDPLFHGLNTDQAWEKAAEEARAAQVPPRPGYAVPLAAAGVLLMAAGAMLGLARLLIPAILMAVIGLALTVSMFAVAGRWKRASSAASAVLARYRVRNPEEITAKAAAYRIRQAAANQAEQRAGAVSDSIRQMTAQREELLVRLLAFVRPFAPTVTDVFGISAALSKALSLDERLATARVKLEGAQKLVSSIPAPTGDGKAASPAPRNDMGGASDHTPQQTAAMLAAVRGELARVDAALAMAQGERNTLGDSAELEARRGALAEELLRRRGEYDALSLALETLGGANAELRARFSPALNARASKIFAALTGEKYAEVSLDRGFEATARETSGIVPHRALTLSQGTVDQLYLAVRLAVCEMALPTEDPAPIVLDDALSNFDDARMALALDYFKALGEREQILLFTCHSREKKYWEKTREGTKA